MAHKTPNEKSPNLKSVSDQEGSERRRMPRLNLTGEQFRLGLNGKIFSVADLSTEGMALRVLEPNDLAVFPVASRIEGTLNLRGEKYPVHAQVRHVGRELVGCEFSDLKDDVRTALKRFLDPEALGRELRPIPAGEGGALWYHGPSGTDLLLWRGSDGQYRRFALFVLGSFAQWEDDSGLTTGRASASYEQSEVRGVVRFETMILDKDPVADAGKLSVAKTVILSSNLPQELRKWCIRQLESKPS
jgi:hypothetical protein